MSSNGSNKTHPALQERAMSRSGYSDCIDDNWALIRWRGAVNSAIRGRRGQAALRELAEAMDAMPVKELIAHELQAEGKYCTLGVLGAARGLDMSKVDTEDREAVAKLFGLAEAMVAEIFFENDEWETFWPKPGLDQAQRWRRMRGWVESQIISEGSNE